MRNKPNILFIMTDEQRFDAVGYRNQEVITPNLDRLKEDSIDFTAAYTGNPSCIPARASIFTGRYPSQCGVPGYMSCLPKRETTFMKLLRDSGYYTAVVGKQHFWKSEIERGYDYEDIVDEHEPPENISLELYEDYFGLPANRTVSDSVSSYVKYLYDHGFRHGSELYRQLSPKGIYEFFGEERFYVDSYIGMRGLEWLNEKRPVDRPWFLTLSFPGPHMPFDGIGLPYADLYDEDSLSVPETTVEDLFKKPPHYLDIVKKYGSVDLEHHTSPDGFSPEEIRLMKKAYFANMTLIDRKIGDVIRRLKELGLYEDTLIIFTSDHGEYMGDFGVASKAQYLSESLMRIPLLVKPPVAGFAGYEERSFASSVEIAATCLTAAGAPVPSNIEQRSLTQFYDKSREPKRHSEMYMEARDIRAIRDERYKLIYYAERPYGEFYDLMADPVEKYNLWDDPRVGREKERLLRRLLDRMVRLGENEAQEWHPTAPPI